MALLWAAALAAQLVGCASSPPTLRTWPCSEKDFPADTSALVLSLQHIYRFGYQPAAAAPPFRHAVDQLSPTDCGVVTPGRHAISVETEWSNGWEESTDLTVDAVAGRRYLVLAFELQPGQDPATARVAIEPLKQDEDPPHGSSKPFFLATGPLGRRIAARSGDESTGEIIAKETAGYLVDLVTAGVGGLFLPILLPAAMMKGIYEEVQSKRAARLAGEGADATTPQPADSGTDGPAQPAGDAAEAAPLTDPAPLARPTGRPFEGCCFVWIEDLDTGELVAGIRPSGCAR